MRYALVACVVLAALPACPVEAEEREASLTTARTWAFTHAVPEELRAPVQAAPALAANAAATAKPAPDAATVQGPPALAAATVAAASALESAVPPPPPPVTLVLSVDLAAQRVTVSERGEVKHVWLISSGRGRYATQTGTFRAQWMTKLWHSRQWDWAPMPHAVFFNSGTAFHATTAVGLLGRPASHGCIRLAPGNAARLYGLVQKHGLASTKVIVHAGAKEPAVARAPAGAPPRKQAKSNTAALAVYQATTAPGPRGRISRYSQPAGFGLWPF